MASPLQNNITNLQSILNMVNNLPNGGTGGSDSTGSNILRDESSFTTNYSGEATVNCGFKPDAVFISIGATDTVESTMCLMFSEQTNQQTYLQTCASATDGLYSAEAICSDTGFFISIINHGWTWSGAALKNTKLYYTAIKYT